MRFLLDSERMKDILQTIVKGCDRPTFIPIMKSMLRTLAEDECDCLHSEATILANAVQVGVFGSTSRQDTNLLGGRWPLKHHPQGDESFIADFSLDDINSLVVLFLYAATRRTNAKIQSQPQSQRNRSVFLGFCPKDIEHHAEQAIQPSPTGGIPLELCSALIEAFRRPLVRSYNHPKLNGVPINPPLKARELTSAVDWAKQFHQTTNLKEEEATRYTFPSLTDEEEVKDYLRAAEEAGVLSKVVPENREAMLELLRQEFQLDRFFNGMNCSSNVPLNDACEALDIGADLRMYPNRGDVPPLKPHQVLGKLIDHEEFYFMRSKISRSTDT